MAKHGKSYNAAAEKIDRATLYTPLQAAKLIKELDTAKFDETVEAHFRLASILVRLTRTSVVPLPAPRHRQDRSCCRLR